jgi:hypothetical protein
MTADTKSYPLFGLTSGTSVALVGNANSLFDYKYGGQIDQCDIVCRINRGVKIKNAECQGGRCDLAFFNVASEFSSFWKICPEYYHLSLKDRDKQKKETKFFPEIYYAALSANLGGKRPSSGLMVLYWVAQHMNVQIKIYGFDWYKTKTYYHSRKRQKLAHDFDLEKDYVQTVMVKNYNIEIFK